MEPRIEILSPKKLAGIRMTMSIAQNTTQALWQKFMPKRKSISNVSGSDLFSVEIYPQKYFDNFNPNSFFEKWAAIEVNDDKSVAENIEILDLPEGLYAVFIHKGPPTKGEETYRYILEQWIPSSEYAVDDRPHMAIMGEKYKHNDSESEEEIWIPIKPKTK